MSSQTAVVVAIMRDSAGHVLLCQRHPSARYPLKWEFPGGKVEPNEKPVRGLERELQEELGIDAVVGNLLHRQVVYYPDSGTFAVNYYAITSWEGEIQNKVFAAITWVHPSEIMRFDILDGNRDICSRLEELLSTNDGR